MPFTKNPQKTTLILQLLSKNGGDIVTLLLSILSTLSKNEREQYRKSSPAYERALALLKPLEHLQTLTLFCTLEEKNLENIRRFIVSEAHDFRVLFVFLAWRITEILYTKKEGMDRFCEENLAIYAPIAKRLGLWNLQTSLEDRSLAYLHPNEFHEIQTRLEASYRTNITEVSAIKQELQHILHEAKISTTMLSRIKTIYSIYRKMSIKKKEWKNISDLFAIRIIVSTIEECYRVLGMIHSTWTPHYDRIKDYIAVPKANGYQSLHTTITSPNGCPIEIQIRTKEMNEKAEYGIAAHWLYGEQKRSKEAGKEFDWVRRIITLEEELSQEKNTNLSYLFANRIFVFVNNSDFLELQKGATLLDAAYALSSRMGRSAFSATIQGKSAHLSMKLHNGDRITIETKKELSPCTEHLSWVKTGLAKEKITTALKQQKLTPIKKKSTLPPKKH